MYLSVWRPDNYSRCVIQHFHRPLCQRRIPPGSERGSGTRPPLNELHIFSLMPFNTFRGGQDNTVGIGAVDKVTKRLNGKRRGASSSGSHREERLSGLKSWAGLCGCRVDALWTCVVSGPSRAGGETTIRPLFSRLFSASWYFPHFQLFYGVKKVLVHWDVGTATVPE